MLAVEFGEKTGQRSVQLIAAVGQQEENRAARYLTSKKEQEIESGLIAPMQIFDNQKQCGTALRHALNEVSERLKEPPFLVLRVQLSCRLEAG